MTARERADASARTSSRDGCSPSRRRWPRRIRDGIAWPTAFGAPRNFSAPPRARRSRFAAMPVRVAACPTLTFQIPTRRRRARSPSRIHDRTARARRRHGTHAQHAAPVPVLDRDRFARGHRHDRARRRTPAGGRPHPARVRRRHRRLQLHRSRVAAVRCARTRWRSGAERVRADGARGGAALRRGGAAPRARRAAAAGADGRGVSRDGGRRRDRAAHGQLSARGCEHRHPDRALSLRRHGLGHLPRRGISRGARGRAPQHHRRVRTRDEDERGRVVDGVAVRALPEEQGLGGRGLLQREGTGSLLPRSAGGARRGRSRHVRDARRAVRAVPERALLRAVQGGQRVAQHAALERGAAGQRAAA